MLKVVGWLRCNTCSLLRTPAYGIAKESNSLVSYHTTNLRKQLENIKIPVSYYFYLHLHLVAILSRRRLGEMSLSTINECSVDAGVAGYQTRKNN